MALTEAQVVATLENAIPNGGEVWIALLLDGVEVSDPIYARVAFASFVTFTDGVPANARRRNGVEIAFGPFAEDGAADTAVVVDTAAGSGIISGRCPLDGFPVTWSAADDLEFAVDALQFRLGD